MIAAAGVMAATGAFVARTGQATATFRAFAIAWVVVGVLSTLIGVIQVFFPELADGVWIARSVEPGRAVGNMRQPNHLSSLLLWSVIAAIYLGEANVVKRSLAAVLSVLMVFGIVITGSRTGTLGVVILGVWGLLDRRLSRTTRLLLVATPLVYMLSWAGLTAWAHESAHPFIGDARLAQKDISSSRFAIWSNVVSLIRMHPWTGVGFGEFNFAWTLTPFPHRPVAFFDHTHNLPLQFAVELGLPMAALLLALLGWSLWRAFVAGRHGEPAQALALRAAFMMVLMMAVHSQLEYPLWYAYFLLPTAFAFGLCLGGPVGSARQESAGTVVMSDSTNPMSGARVLGDATDGTAYFEANANPDVATPTAAEAVARLGLMPSTAAPAYSSGTSARPQRRTPATTLQAKALLVASLLVLLGGIASLFDYLPVVEIFDPPADAGSLASRIETGQRSWFFAHHADYAAGTTAAHPSEAMDSFKRASHFLLDARLMMAWSKALAEAGELEKARYLAQRLKEFKNPTSAEFFAECEGFEPNAPDAPYQCTPPKPTSTLTFKDFRK